MQSACFIGEIPRYFPSVTMLSSQHEYVLCPILDYTLSEWFSSRLGWGWWCLRSYYICFTPTQSYHCGEGLSLAVRCMTGIQTIPCILGSVLCQIRLEWKNVLYPIKTEYVIPPPRETTLSSNTFVSYMPPF